MRNRFRNEEEELTKKHKFQLQKEDEISRLKGDIEKLSKQSNDVTFDLEIARHNISTHEKEVQLKGPEGEGPAAPQGGH